MNENTTSGNAVYQGDDGEYYLEREGTCNRKICPAEDIHPESTNESSTEPDFKTINQVLSALTGLMVGGYIHISGYSPIVAITGAIGVPILLNLAVEAFAYVAIKN